MKLYNSLTKKIEEVTPLVANEFTVYTCGPTVYDYATIGNFRTYTTSDLIVRTLQFLGNECKFIMNLTDVGHLTGDNEGDADTGEDRLEKSAKKHGKNAWEIASFYSEAFLKEFKKLNLIEPLSFVKATDHIQEQIDLIKQIEDKGMTYKTSDGIYFDTVNYENKTGHKYGEISNLDQIKEGARVEVNPEKKNPRDFALWKFSKLDEKRHMEWSSPWGTGFPGWHIECSAMSMKYLGETIDIHVGGEDLRSTHHPNEIAQSEAATGKKFVNYWVHAAFLQVNGGRMGKSLGNAYTVQDIESKGFSLMALRYFYLTGHYRSKLNFTWEALQSAQNAYDRLGRVVVSWKTETSQSRHELSNEKLSKIDDFRQQFIASITNDLNMPQALSVLWGVVDSNIPSIDKYELVMSFDEVLGLRLSEFKIKEYLNLERNDKSITIPLLSLSALSNEIVDLIDLRDKAKASKEYDKADMIRKRLENEFKLKITDSKEGTVVDIL